jgi:hypothetical protein
MIGCKKDYKFMDIIKEGFNFISQIISGNIFPKIAEGTDMIMKNIDDRLKIIESRIQRKVISLFIIGFGGIFLILALFFFLIENVGWNKATAFFSIGIIFFITGLMLKLGENER